MFKANKQPSNVEECTFLRGTNGLKILEEAHLSNLIHDIKEKWECKVKQEVSWVKKKHDLNDSVIESSSPSPEKAYVLEMKRPPEHLKKARKKRLKQLLKHDELKMQNPKNTKIQNFRDEKTSSGQYF